MADTNTPLLGRKKLIGLTEETTSGTAATVTAAIAANYYDVKAEAGDFFSAGKRQPAGNYNGSIPSLAGKRMGTIEATLEYIPGLLAHITGCGYKITTGTYAPSSTMADRKTWTVVCWEDGIRKQLTGAVLELTLEGNAGEKVTAKCKWTGIWVAPIDQAMPARAPITTAPYMSRSLTLTFGGAAIAHVSKWSINLGASIEERQDITASTGISHYLVTDIDPTINLDPEARLVADMDAYGLMLAGTTVLASLVLSSGGASLTISAAAAQRVKVTSGERDRKALHEIELLCCVSNGNDQLTLAQS